MTINMSPTKKREKYINGLTTRNELLILLAKKKELEQYDLPNKMGITRRHIIRCLRDLEVRDLIHLKRTEQSEKGGTPKNIWEITFEGIMEVLYYLNEKEINSVAELHKDKWIIFSELSFLLKNFYIEEKTKKLFYYFLKLVSKKFCSLECDPLQPIIFPNEEINAMEPQIREYVEKSIKDACTNQVLGIRYLTDPVKYFSGYDMLKMEKFWLKNQKMKLTKLMENEAIKNYLAEQFDKAEKAFSSLKLINPFREVEL